MAAEQASPLDIHFMDCAMASSLAGKWGFSPFCLSANYWKQDLLLIKGADRCCCKHIDMHKTPEVSVGGGVWKGRWVWLRQGFSSFSLFKRQMPDFTRFALTRWIKWHHMSRLLLSRFRKSSANIYAGSMAVFAFFQLQPAEVITLLPPLIYCW